MRQRVPGINADFGSRRFRAVLKLRRLASMPRHVSWLGWRSHAQLRTARTFRYKNRRANDPNGEPSGEPRKPARHGRWQSGALDKQGIQDSGITLLAQGYDLDEGEFP